MNVELIAHEIQDIITETNEKTLIICYKSIVDRYGNEFNFEDDLKKILKILRIRFQACIQLGISEQLLQVLMILGNIKTLFSLEC